MVQGPMPFADRGDGAAKRWCHPRRHPAEVNRGLNCVKGYFLSKIMYGADRLTQPLLRMKDGKYAKDGEFQPVSWDQAFDVMAEQFKRALKDKGPTAVGMFGSGQWTIWEGYAAAKLMKAGFRSTTSIPTRATAWPRPPSPASCAPSASTSRWAATTTSRPPTPSCSGARTWPRCTRSCGPASPTAASAPRTSRSPCSRPSSTAATSSPTSRSSFTPQTDLAILNFIAHHIIKNNAVNQDFIDKHTTFRLGNDDIGYGLRPEHPLQKKAKNAKPTPAAKPITFEEFAKFVATYTLDYRAKLTGVPKNRCEALAELYADPKIKVMSFWTMGFNQHTRGVWATTWSTTSTCSPGRSRRPATARSR